jgi:hypothetical protein
VLSVTASGHIEEYLLHLHEHINPRNNKPLSLQTRYTYLSPLAQFFRETAQWGWSNVPARPLLAVRFPEASGLAASVHSARRTRPSDGSH